MFLSCHSYIWCLGISTWNVFTGTSDVIVISKVLYKRCQVISKALNNTFSHSENMLKGTIKRLGQFDLALFWHLW